MRDDSSSGKKERVDFCGCCSAPAGLMSVPLPEGCCCDAKQRHLPSSAGNAAAPDPLQKRRAVAAAVCAQSGAVPADDSDVGCDTAGGSGGVLTSTGAAECDPVTWPR